MYSRVDAAHGEPVGVAVPHGPYGDPDAHRDKPHTDAADAEPNTDHDVANTHHAQLYVDNPEPITDQLGLSCRG